MLKDAQTPVIAEPREHHTLVTPARVLMAPGPTNLPPAVQQSLLAPLVGHKDPAYLRVMDETADLLRAVFLTQNAVSSRCRARAARDGSLPGQPGRAGRAGDHRRERPVRRADGGDRPPQRGRGRAARGGVGTHHRAGRRASGARREADEARGDRARRDVDGRAPADRRDLAPDPRAGGAAGRRRRGHAGRHRGRLRRVGRRPLLQRQPEVP